MFSLEQAPLRMSGEGWITGGDLLKLHRIIFFRNCRTGYFTSPIFIYLSIAIL